MFYPDFGYFGRERLDLGVPSQLTVTHRWTFNGAPSASYPSTIQTRNFGRVMGDTVTDHFRRAVAAGQIVNHNMVSWQSDSTYLPFQFTWSGRNTSNDILTVYSWAAPKPGGATAVPSSAESAWRSLKDPFGYGGLRDAAIVKAWSKVDESSMNALASLGELPETLKWLQSVVSRMNNLLRLMFKRGSVVKKTSARKVSLKDVPFDYWMEWRYAIRPLIFEMQSIREAIAAIIDKGSRATSRSREEKYDGPVVSETLVSGSFTCSSLKRSVIEVSFSGGVLYDLSDSLDDLLVVLGLDQPLEAAYALTRLSFVLDWFFNVGDIISSWSTGIGLSPKTSWVTMKYVERTTTQYMNPSYAVPGYTQTSFTVSDTASHTLQRTVKHRWREPSTFVLPTFKLKLNAAKIIDLCAIGKQLLTRK